MVSVLEDLRNNSNGMGKDSIYENPKNALPFEILSSVNSKCLWSRKSKGNVNIECNRHKYQKDTALGLSDSLTFCYDNFTTWSVQLLFQHDVRDTEAKSHSHK